MDANEERIYISCKKTDSVSNRRVRLVGRGAKCGETRRFILSDAAPNNSHADSSVHCCFLRIWIHVSQIEHQTQSKNLPLSRSLSPSMALF